MKGLNDVNLDSLRWEQTGRLNSRLLGGAETVATLDWANGWGSLATGETAQGKWTFKRVGFLRPRVTIRRAGSNQNVAVASMKWLGGSIMDFTETNGTSSSFQLKRTGLLQCEWILTDSNGEKVLTMRPYASQRRQSSSLHVEPSGKATTERLSLLVTFSWYLQLLTSRQDEGAFSAALVAVMVAST